MLSLVQTINGEGPPPMRDPPLPIFYSLALYPVKGISGEKRKIRIFAAPEAR
jgi:hypothetical protein